MENPNDGHRLFLAIFVDHELRQVPGSVGILRPSKWERDSEVGMKILLATDGSKYSAAAVRSVAGRPWANHTNIKLVSVIDPAELPVDPLYGLGEMAGRAGDIKKEQAQEALKAAASILDNAGLSSVGIALMGDAKARIIDEAKEWGADLVVVGAQGRGAIDRILQGSVSEAVAIHAPCSVEVIRDPSHS